MGPTTKLVFLGLEIDSVRQLVSVPQEKLQAIISKVSGALESEKLTLSELQTLVGSLSFICRAVPPGRAFLRRLIDLQIGIKDAWHKIRISPGAKADFLNSYDNGSSVFMNQNGVFDYELQWFTDGSGGIGFGFFFSTEVGFRASGQMSNLVRVIPLRGSSSSQS